MKRLAAAFCLLALPGLASAFEVSIGPNPVIVNPPPPSALGPGDFQLVFEESSSRVFIIADFSSLIGEGMRQADQREMLLPLGAAAMLRGDTPLVTVEEEGVRLPDERFTLP